MYRLSGLHVYEIYKQTKTLKANANASAPQRTSWNWTKRRGVNNNKSTISHTGNTQLHPPSVSLLWEKF